MTDIVATLGTWLRVNGWLTDWLLLLVAIVAAWFTLVQIRHARQVQDEQARPYVVADIRRVTGGIVELYVKNFGSTAAYDVRMTSEPAIESVTDPGFTVFEVIPTLVPQKEWSTICEDYAQKRKAAGAPDRFEITVSYRGSAPTARGKGRSGQEFTDHYVIDWAPFWPSTFVVQKDMDDLVKAVQDIHRSIGRDQLGQRNLVQSGHSIAESLQDMPTPSVPTRGVLARIRRHFWGRVHRGEVDS